jgi:hypothetical protein
VTGCGKGCGTVIVCGMGVVVSVEVWYGRVVDSCSKETNDEWDVVQAEYIRK